MVYGMRAPGTLKQYIICMHKYLEVLRKRLGTPRLALRAVQRTGHQALQCTRHVVLPAQVSCMCSGGGGDHQQVALGSSCAFSCCTHGSIQGTATTTNQPTHAYC